MANSVIYANYWESATLCTMPATRRIPGKDLWVYTKGWRYTAKDGTTYKIPAGFVTDLDSIPRIPIIYAILKGRSVAGFGLHDWLYRKDSGVSRKKADDLMREVAKWEGTRNRYIKPIYLAVRLLGASRYQKKPATRFRA